MDLLPTLFLPPSRLFQGIRIYIVIIRLVHVCFLSTMTLKKILLSTREGEDDKKVNAIRRWVSILVDPMSVEDRAIVDRRWVDENGNP